MLQVTKRNETPFQTYQFKKIIFKIQKIKCKTNNSLLNTKLSRKKITIYDVTLYNIKETAVFLMQNVNICLITYIHRPLYSAVFYL